MYDIVWYSPDKVEDAGKVLVRLDVDEAIERGVPDVHMSLPCNLGPFPDVQGRVAMRNFLGTHLFLSKYGIGSPDLTGLCDVTILATGLAGGNLHPKVLVSDEIKDAERIQEQREEAHREPRIWNTWQLLSEAKWAFYACLLALCAAVVAIPRTWHPPAKRTLRSLPELEVEAQFVMAAVPQMYPKK